LEELGREVFSVLKNAYIVGFDLLEVLHLRSDFDVQMQADEVIRSFSTACIIPRQVFSDKLRTSSALALERSLSRLCYTVV
jgi:hypothetical protein